MEGSFDTIGLSDVLEMIGSQRLSGRLRLEADIPYRKGRSGKLPLELRLREGEITGGHILDWEGMEAISTFPLHTERGHFAFKQGVANGQPLMPLKALLGEWARMNDQWTRFRGLLDSPSRVLETPRAAEPYALFVGGKSVRAAARAWNVPLIIAVERAWRGVREGDLSKMRKYAWYALRIRHPSARRTQVGLVNPSDLTVLLNGSRNLGELIQGGIPIEHIRSYLIGEISGGGIDVPGKGWILRDLLWEVESEAAAQPVKERR